MARRRRYYRRKTYRRRYRRRRGNSQVPFILALVMIIPVGLAALGVGQVSVERLAVLVLGLVMLAVVFVAGVVWLMSWRKKLQLRGVNMEVVDAMNGEEFEHYVAFLCKAQGFDKIRVTSYQGDFGADLVGKWNGEKWAIQAKRYSGDVGVEAVYQVLGGKEYYEATRAMVITNRHVTKPAAELAYKSKVMVVDRPTLIEWVKKARQQESS